MSVYWLNVNSHDDQLQGGFIAQLAEYCTGIVGVRVQIPFKPEIFRLSFHYCSSNVNNCDDQHLNLIKAIQLNSDLSIWKLNPPDKRYVFSEKPERAGTLTQQINNLYIPKNYALKAIISYSSLTLSDSLMEPHLSIPGWDKSVSRCLSVMFVR